MQKKKKKKKKKLRCLLLAHQIRAFSELGVHVYGYAHAVKLLPQQFTCIWDVDLHHMLPSLAEMAQGCAGFIHGGWTLAI
jgi:hypothetical protein